MYSDFVWLFKHICSTNDKIQGSQSIAGMFCLYIFIWNLTSSGALTTSFITRGCCTWGKWFLFCVMNLSLSFLSCSTVDHWSLWSGIIVLHSDRDFQSMVAYASCPHASLDLKCLLTPTCFADHWNFRSNLINQGKRIWKFRKKKCMHDVSGILFKFYVVHLHQKAAIVWDELSDPSIPFLPSNESNLIDQSFTVADCFQCIALNKGHIFSFSSDFLALDGCSTSSFSLGCHHYGLFHSCSQPPPPPPPPPPHLSANAFLWGCWVACELPELITVCCEFCC